MLPILSVISGLFNNFRCQISIIEFFRLTKFKNDVICPDLFNFTADSIHHRQFTNLCGIRAQKMRTDKFHGRVDQSLLVQLVSDTLNEIIKPSGAKQISEVT